MTDGTEWEVETRFSSDSEKHDWRILLTNGDGKKEYHWQSVCVGGYHIYKSMFKI